MRALASCLGDEARINEAEAELAQLRKIEEAADAAEALLLACRSSVKTDLNAYERLLIAKQKHSEQETPMYKAAEAEAQRLFDLLEKIDALALKTPAEEKTK